VSAFRDCRCRRQSRHWRTEVGTQAGVDTVDSAVGDSVVDTVDRAVSSTVPEADVDLLNQDAPRPQVLGRSSQVCLGSIICIRRRMMEMAQAAQMSDSVKNLVTKM